MGYRTKGPLGEHLRTEKERLGATQLGRRPIKNGTQRRGLKLPNIPTEIDKFEGENRTTIRVQKKKKKSKQGALGKETAGRVQHTHSLPRPRCDAAIAGGTNGGSLQGVGQRVVTSE